MAIKVDLEKAYDQLEWDFIEDTLHDLRLPTHFVTWIIHHVRSVSTQIIWNGDLTDSFRPFQLALHFVLCMERLSHAIVRLVQHGNWKYIYLSRHGSNLSHLFFVDDLVLFTEATGAQLDVIKDVMINFCACFGIKLLWRKCMFTS
ncbi:hypothetical protein HRI_001654400 [Hibiscus trionum]|uniref:Reverse transcriptase domain-containing protein n=1 Tax=Hibiscus trionum TaxID=183268 RepID=A0A9W7LXL3_HIBTR|nr:hypothetical protein HRI_001654400 [Hibiscus trionum]